MTLDKESVLIVGIFFGLALLGFGLMGLGIDMGQWFPLIVGVFAGLTLISQVGVKVIWSLHKITKMTWMQYISLTLGISNIINATMSILPFLGQSLSSQLAPWLLIASAVWFFVELFSQQK